MNVAKRERVWPRCIAPTSTQRSAFRAVAAFKHKLAGPLAPGPVHTTLTIEKVRCIPVKRGLCYARHSSTASQQRRTHLICQLLTAWKKDLSDATQLQLHLRCTIHSSSTVHGFSAYARCCGDGIHTLQTDSALERSKLTRQSAWKALMD